MQYAAPTMTGTSVDVNRNGTPDVLQQPQFNHMGTMTVTDVDMNRNDTPDASQQPQFGLAPRGLAAPVQHGTPVNRSTMTVTRVDLIRNGIPDVVQQPQFGIDLTMEEREDLTVLLIAVRYELLDRDEDPALVDLVYQLMDRLLDADTSEIADDARATIPHLHHLWCGTRRFDLTIDDSDEDVGDEEDIGEDYGIAALVPIRYTLVSKCGNQRRTAPRRRGPSAGGATPWGT